MATFNLSAEKRDVKVSLDKIRAEGKMPAVFYGPKESSTSVSVSLVDFKKVWKKAGESAVVILNDGKENHETLIHEVDIHPLSGEPRHADFYVLEKGKKVEVAVPLVFVGVSSAVKDKAGILVKVLREIEIEALPKDLPQSIEVDISKLVELTDTIHAKDLTIPAGVEIKVGADDIIASISVAKEEVEAPTTIDMSAIEVSDAKGKEVKEGEEAAAPAKEEKK
ncbi:MAG: 50S ribosomal protein L25 [Candidatus Taylorbacteria bacterium]